MEAVNKFLLIFLCCVLSAAVCQNCNHCEGCCFTMFNSTALCKCDEDCQEFGDCCGTNSSSNYSLTSPTSVLSGGVKLECLSVHTQPGIQVTAESEAFFMVFSCPDSWFDSDNESYVESNCTMPTETLPPVTDGFTGLVYRNEYCAQCNGVIDFIYWSSRLICRREIQDVFEHPCFPEILNANPNIIQVICKSCIFAPPDLSHTALPPPRSCIPRVDTCLPQTELEAKLIKNLEESNYKTIVDKCQSGLLNPVCGVRSCKVYLNHACAVCNGENITACFQLKSRDICDSNNECSNVEQKTEGKGNSTCTGTHSDNKIVLNKTQSCREDNGPVFLDSPSPFSISATISSLGNRHVKVVVQSPIKIIRTFTSCKYGEYRLDTECLLEKPVVNCSTNHTEMINNDSYVDLDNDTIFVKKTGIIATVIDRDEDGHLIVCQDSYNASDVMCPSDYIALNTSHFVKLDNDTIIVGNDIITVKAWDKHGRPLICSNLIESINNNTVTVHQEYLPGLQILTYIGSSLSVIGTVAVLLTYSIFKELQTFPGLVLMNLCVAIFGTNLLFIIGGPILQYHPLKQICAARAIFLHYFYLSQFSWMSIFAFEMMKNLYQARKLVQDSRQTKCKYLAVYLTLGWVLPLTICTITIILNFTTDGLILYGVNSEGQRAKCWINQYQAFLIAFILPLALSHSINLLFFFITTVYLCRAYKDQVKIGRSDAATMIRIWVAVFTITGLTWVFGFLAIAHDFQWMNYPFTIFNSTQGLGIFFAFIFTKKVWNLYKRLVQKILNKNFNSHKNEIQSFTLESTITSQ